MLRKDIGPASRRERCIGVEVRSCHDWLVYGCLKSNLGWRTSGRLDMAGMLSSYIEVVYSEASHRDGRHFTSSSCLSHDAAHRPTRDLELICHKPSALEGSQRSRTIHAPPHISPALHSLRLRCGLQKLAPRIRGQATADSGRTPTMQRLYFTCPANNCRILRAQVMGSCFGRSRSSRVEKDVMGSDLGIKGGSPIVRI